MKRIAFILFLLTALATSGVLLVRPATQASPDVTITVNSIADTNVRDSVMTLREAMLMATGDLAVTDLSWDECQQVSGASWSLYWCMSPVPIGADTPETIVFDASVFPPGSPATITLNFTLPTLSTGNDTIDGSSAGVIVDGGGVGFDCLTIESDSNTIKGLQIYNCYTAITLIWGAQYNTIGGTTEGARNVISGNDVLGVLIVRGDTNDNVVRGNYIGTDASGTAALPNGEEGVVIAGGAQGNTVQGNVISGNTDSGVHITDSDNNVVKGNYMGTDATGTAAIANDIGVYISDGAQNNTIGGTTDGERNVISGNIRGVSIVGDGTNGNAVKGNYIGTNANGTNAIANGTGVYIHEGAQNNTIGGSSASDRNVISGNSYEGVFISDSDTTGNPVKGNYIGTNASGTAGLPNGAQGVAIGVGAQDNTIGGTAAGEGNLIAYNEDDGVWVYDTGTTGNTIRGNSIHSNGDMGIVHSNGGNAELARPVITNSGPAMGTACVGCTVDIYSDDEDEGRIYEGSTTANGAGNWTYVGAVTGPNVTATATDAAGNTSEFSAPVAAPEPSPTPSPTPGVSPTPGASPTPPAGPTRTLVWAPGWHNDTWTGASTPAEAFACAAGSYAAAYRFTDAGLERYFPDRPDISDMGPLAQYDAFLILVTQPVTCLMPVAASGATRTLQWSAGWHNDAWSGADGTPPQQAFACADGSYAAAYRFTDAGLERYIPDRPDISTMGPLNRYDAFLILVTTPAACTMPVVP